MSLPANYPTFLQFLYSMATGATEVFEQGASNLFRTESNVASRIAGKLKEADHDLHTSVFEPMIDMVQSTNIDNDWLWFKYMMTATFMTILVIVGILFVLWLLS